MAIKYTEEQKEFLKRYLPEHTHAETVVAYNRQFPDSQITVKQSRSFTKNYKVKSSNDGRFKKGQQAHNKGKKFPGMKNSGQFKKGNRPYNWKPVGSVRITRDNYIEIKVEEPRKWKLLHIYIWEMFNGPVPDGHRVIFKDGNTGNCNIDNLMLISDKELLQLNKLGWRTEYCSVTEAYVNLLRLMNKRKEVTNGKNED